MENVKSLGFYSRLFLVPKPRRKVRPVIDLSRLNTFLHIEKFKMETPESIRTSLIPGERVSSIDFGRRLPAHPHPPKLKEIPKVCYKAQVFQFTSLPFGLATAPQVFTMIVKEVKLMALSRGLRIHQYLEGPRWQSGNTLASHLCGRGSIPVMAVSGKAGSCLPLVGSLQYRTLANYMYWFPLPFQLPVVI